MINKLLRGSAERITFVDQAMASGGSFILTIAMVRSLGLANFGVYSALFIIYLFMLGLQQVLIHAPMMVFFPKASSSSRLMTDYFVIEMAFIILALLTWIIVDSILASWMPVSLKLEYVVTLSTMLLLEFLRKVYTLLRKPIMVIVLNMMILTEVFLLLVLPYFSISISFDQFLWMASSINSLGIIIGFISYPFLFHFSEFKSVIRESLQYSKWLLSGSLLQWYSGNYLLLLAQAKFGMVALGGIRAAQAFLGPISVTLAALENAVTIQGAELFAKSGWNSFIQYWKARLKFSFIIFVAGLLLLMALTPWLVKTIYKISSAEVITLVRWLLVANFLVIVNTLFRSAFKVINRTGAVLIISVVQVLFFALCGGWLLNVFHLNGVALGIGLAQALSVIISTIYWYKYATSYSPGIR